MVTPLEKIGDILRQIVELHNIRAQHIQQLQQQQTRQHEQLNRLRTRVETLEQEHAAARDNLDNRMARIETTIWLAGRKRRREALPEPDVDSERWRSYDYVSDEEEDRKLNLPDQPITVPPPSSAAVPAAAEPTPRQHIKCCGCSSLAGTNHCVECGNMFCWRCVNQRGICFMCAGAFPDEQPRMAPETARDEDIHHRRKKKKVRRVPKRPQADAAGEGPLAGDAGEGPPAEQDLR